MLTTEAQSSFCTSYLDIPAGTYPENRLVDGAIGSYEDLVASVGTGFGSIGPESTLDFQASIPLIWPQTTVLFQTDDEYWEIVGSEGFFNSKTTYCSLFTCITDRFKLFLMLLMVATAPTVPSTRPVIALTHHALTPSTQIPIILRLSDIKDNSNAACISLLT